MNGIQVTDYPILAAMQANATGGIERKELYSRGVTDAIALLERDGSIPRPSIADLMVLYGAQKATATAMLTKDEAEMAESFIRANAWEMEQAEEYCRGFNAVQQVAQTLGVGRKSTQLE